MAIRLMWVRDWPYGKEDGQVIENAELVASYRTDAPDIARRLQSALARIATLEAEQREADDALLWFFRETTRLAKALPVTHSDAISAARARREARESGGGK